jgi:23S rRNA (uracil1939-C5)-methyltransferase
LSAKKPAQRHNDQNRKPSGKPAGSAPARKGKKTGGTSLDGGFLAKKSRNASGSGSNRGSHGPSKGTAGSRGKATSKSGAGSQGKDDKKHASARNATARNVKPAATSCAAANASAKAHVRKSVKPTTKVAKPAAKPTGKSAKALKPSACPVSHQCGACQLIDVPYAKQLQAKQAYIVELFDELATEETALLPILGMQDPYHYRNKVASPYAPGCRIKDDRQYSVRGQKRKGKNKPKVRREVLCGMYVKGTHHIIPTDDCLIENTTAKRIILAIRDLMTRYDIEPYDEDAGTGFMRHAIVRVGHSSGEILVTLITNQREFPGAKNFAQELVKRVPEITTIVQNVNTRMTNVLLGNEGENVLYGPGFILDELCGLRFRISSHSFYQVNATQTEMLYRSAIGMAKLTGTETVIDAYCGTGTIGLVAAKGLFPGQCAGRVLGVDEVPSAIDDARNNARHNSIENADFFVDDAGPFMRTLAATSQGEDGVDVLLMDPPRAGASEEFLAATCELAPGRIVYISCNPATQARDVDYLIQRGYHLVEIQPVDMFPHTNHVESVVSLARGAMTT